MAEFCDLTLGCTFPPHAPDAHPCGVKWVPGAPCRFCGKPEDVWPCPDCTQPITIADFRGLMAEEGIETVVTLAGEERTDG